MHVASQSREDLATSPHRPRRPLDADPVSPRYLAVKPLDAAAVEHHQFVNS